MIQSFADRETQRLFETGKSRKWVNIQNAAKIKLDALAVARELDHLRRPPGNRLEALKGRRSGQYSIRINDQFRICFTWNDGAPGDVEIVDYH